MTKSTQLHNLRSLITRVFVVTTILRIVWRTGVQFNLCCEQALRQDATNSKQQDVSLHTALQRRRCNRIESPPKEAILGKSGVTHKPEVHEVSLRRQKKILEPRP